MKMLDLNFKLAKRKALLQENNHWKVRNCYKTIPKSKFRFYKKRKEVVKIFAKTNSRKAVANVNHRFLIL